MARGGRRVNRQPHPNRTDLDLAPSTDTYGEKASMQRQLDALPLKAAPAPVARPVSRPAVAPPLPMDRPSDRPWEPITAGLPMGAGPGPEVLGLDASPAATLRFWYTKYPFEELRELIEVLEWERSMTALPMTAPSTCRLATNDASA